MASRRPVPASVRDNLLGMPSDVGSLERNYVLPNEDLDVIATRRCPDNRLGLAVHIALLRHPGEGWLEGLHPLEPLVAWLAEQVDVSSEALTRHAARGANALRAQATGDTAPRSAGLLACRAHMRSDPHQGRLERLKHVRALGLPRDLDAAIHPARLAKFVREGALAPLTLLNGSATGCAPATCGSKATGTTAASMRVCRRRTKLSRCSPKAGSRPTPESGSPVGANRCTSAWAKWGRSWHVVWSVRRRIGPGPRIDVSTGSRGLNQRRSAESSGRFWRGSTGNEKGEEAARHRDGKVGRNVRLFRARDLSGLQLQDRK